tara:strand:+ start:521 stop:1186 length:666 start_codon:yes stop_codon:yes gene_type:complete
MSAVATGLLIGAGVAKVGSAIAQGVGNRRAAKAMRLTPAQEAELARLKARQARGELGLTSGEEGKIRRQFDAAQDAATRDLQNMQLQQQAAQPQAVSGRQIFLQAQAEQEALRLGARQEGIAVLEASQAERANEQRRIAELEGQATAAEAALKAANASFVTGSFDAAADIGMQGATMAFQSEMQKAAVPKQSTQSVYLRYQPTPPAGEFSFGDNFVPLTFE